MQWVRLLQGRDEVCGIRDHKPWDRDHKPWDRDHKPWDRDHKPWDRDHKPWDRDHKPWARDLQYFDGSGIRLYLFCGIRDQTLTRFWSQGSDIWVQKWDTSLKPRSNGA